jgi:hypothetical protein
MAHIEILRQFLTGISEGEIPIQHVRTVEEMLAACWKDELTITSHGAEIEPYQLLGRTEALTWNPPILELEIERHGATVKGSVYADIHHWTVNVFTAEASMMVDRRRLVTPRDEPLDVKPLAREIATLILGHELDPRLDRKSVVLVRLRIGQIIPRTNQQTTLARRRRFVTALEAELAPHGWKKTAVNTFALQVPVS